MFAASFPMGNRSLEVISHQSKVTGLARVEAGRDPGSLTVESALSINASLCLARDRNLAAWLYLLTVKENKGEPGP